MTKKRLILFLILTFGLTWAIFGLWAGLGGRYLDAEGNITSMGSLMAVLAMVCPTVGCCLPDGERRKALLCVDRVLCCWESV